MVIFISAGREGEEKGEDEGEGEGERERGREGEGEAERERRREAERQRGREAERQRGRAPEYGQLYQSSLSHLPTPLYFVILLLYELLLLCFDIFWIRLSIWEQVLQNKQCRRGS